MKTNRIFLASLFWSLLVLFYCNEASAQISMGGEPPSFSMSSLSEPATIRMPAVNVDSLIQNDTVKDYSFRFGYAMDLNVGLENSGTWDVLDNGDKLWRLKINCPDAFSINLIYDDYWLPEGAQFFVYSEDRSMVLGAFTAEVSNNEHNKFATDLVKGDMLVLEYFEPADVAGARLNISKVIHGYIDTYSGFGQSSWCNIDVACSQGDDWCVEKRAASMILVDNNTRWCSGCLVNNVRQDLTPYYLTANHCLRGDENTWIFRFKYWSPTCNQGLDATHWVSITGSTVRANHSGSDFALLELAARPPSGFGVLYAGWNNQNIAPPSGASITHPRGDVMKIGLYNQTPTQQTFLGSSDWRIVWAQGTVEPGSSGGPLFNNNHLIIGQVHGGTPSDICTSNDHAFFGRFDVSWNGGGTTSTRLRDWLDPDNTGATSVGPTSPPIYLINKTLTATHNFAALNEMQIEGNVVTSGLSMFCPPSTVPFSTEPGSNVTAKARFIEIYPGTELKYNSNVALIATNVQCSDNLVEGNYVDVFCIAQVRMLEVNNQENENEAEEQREENKLELSDNIVLYPNPTDGIINVRNNQSADLSFILSNVQGNVLMNNQLRNEKQIDLKHLPPGIYLIQLTNTQTNEAKQFRIVKM